MKALLGHMMLVLLCTQIIARAFPQDDSDISDLDIGAGDTNDGDSTGSDLFTDDTPTASEDSNTQAPQAPPEDSNASPDASESDTNTGTNDLAPNDADAPLPTVAAAPEDPPPNANDPAPDDSDTPSPDASAAPEPPTPVSPSLPDVDASYDDYPPDYTSDAYVQEQDTDTEDNGQDASLGVPQPTDVQEPDDDTENNQADVSLSGPQPTDAPEPDNNTEDNEQDMSLSGPQPTDIYISADSLFDLADASPTAAPSDSEDLPLSDFDLLADVAATAAPPAFTDSSSLNDALDAADNTDTQLSSARAADGQQDYPLPSGFPFSQNPISNGKLPPAGDKGLGKGTALASGDRSGSSVAFVAYIRKLYNLAVQYAASEYPHSKQSHSPNVLVAEWLRHADYNDNKWTALVGPIDRGFTQAVNKAGIQMIDFIVEPEYHQQIKVSHLGACINGVLVAGEAGPQSTNAGDVTGWGGDLITFYGEWQLAVHGGKKTSPHYIKRAPHPSGSEFARQNLANDHPTTFKLRDMVEDADCYNIATQLLHNGGSTNIADLIESNLRNGYRSRMQRFFSNRFGSAQAAQQTARNMLLPGSNVVINAGRIKLIYDIAGADGFQPFALEQQDPSALDDFVKGFAERIVQLVNEERGRAGG